MRMSRKKKEKIAVVIYQDIVMKFWSMHSGDKYWTGFKSKEDIIKYCQDNNIEIIKMED